MNDDMQITDEMIDYPDIEDVCHEEISELDDFQMKLISVEKEIVDWETDCLADRAPDPKIDEHYFTLLGYKDFLAKKVKSLRRVEAKKNNEKNLIKKALLIQESGVLESKTLAFMARSMVLTSMPCKKPKNNEYTMQNGDQLLYMSAPKKIGLPYGSIPRLIVAYFTTQAIKTRKRDIELGDTLSQFMRELDMIPTGGRWGSITRLKEQMNRLIATSIYSGTHNEFEHNTKKMDFVQSSNILWQTSNPDQTNIFPNTVRLGEGFFEQIMKNAVPLDMRILKALKKSPLAIDLYLFLNYRLPQVKKYTPLTWEILHQIFGSDYEKQKHFKPEFNKAYDKVCLFAKEFKLSIDSKKGLTLHPSPLHIPKK